jgi:hypothetical protein
MSKTKKIVYAMNKQGEYLHDLIMKNILGVQALPEGFEVAFKDGNTLNCQRSNLMLVPLKGDL